MAGTSSSAATKCISEVPGLAKQTSTPASTRVERRARAPFTSVAPVRATPSSRSGPEDARGVEGPFDGAHELQRHRILQLQEVGQLRRPDAVLARDGTPDAQGQLEAGVHEGVPPLVVGLEDRDVDVAVADVAAPRDEGAVLLRQHGHLGQVVGDGGPRETASMRSSHPAALPTKKARSRAAMSCGPRRRGQHVHVERPQLLQQRRRGVRRPLRPGRRPCPPGPPRGRRGCGP